jgi:peroxiredoxin
MSHTTRFSHAFALALVTFTAACTSSEPAGGSANSSASAPSEGATGSSAAGATETPAAEPEVATLGALAPNFSLASHTGATHALADFRGKPVVLEWTNYECPVVRGKYDGGEMQALQRSAVERGAVWLSICSSGPSKQGHMDTATAARRFAEENAGATALLLDADGTVGRRYEAQTTPHMFVIDAAGTLVYAGAIDDQKGTNHVATTLDALFAGQSVEPRSTKPYGCSVKYAN